MNYSADTNVKYIAQGQFLVSDSPGDIFSCILGSCVAACIRDPRLQLGGMNHFLLPGHDPRGGANVRYGARSMEELVNALQRRGADRRRLEVWLYGGASVLGTSTGIGAANCAFAQDFVRTEGFTLRGSDLGGTQGRRVKFNARNGTTEVTLVKNPGVETVAPPPRPARGQEIELF